MIYSHDLSKPTILIEIKRVKKTEKMDSEDLDKILTETAKQAPFAGLQVQCATLRP